MGNFESLRLDISLSAEGTGHPDTTFNRVYEWTQEKLLEKMAEVEAELNADDDKEDADAKEA